MLGPTNKATAVTLRVGVAFQPWTAWRFDLDGKPLDAPPVEVELQDLRKTIDVLRAGPLEGGVALWARPLSSNSQQGAIALVAIDKSGQEFSAKSASSDGKERCSRFDVPLAAFDRFEFRLRAYRHWVRFENVLLQF